jgi:hypothetical protein
MRREGTIERVIPVGTRRAVSSEFSRKPPKDRPLAIYSVFLFQGLFISLLICVGTSVGSRAAISAHNFPTSSVGMPKSLLV